MQLYCSHVHSHEAGRILFMIPRIVSLCIYINYSSEQHRIGWEDHRIKLVYVEKQGARRVRLVQNGGRLGYSDRDHAGGGPVLPFCDRSREQ